MDIQVGKMYDKYQNVYKKKNKATEEKKQQQIKRRFTFTLTKVNN